MKHKRFQHAGGRTDVWSTCTSSALTHQNTPVHYTNTVNMHLLRPNTPTHTSTLHKLTHRYTTQTQSTCISSSAPYLGARLAPRLALFFENRVEHVGDERAERVQCCSANQARRDVLLRLALLRDALGVGGARVGISNQWLERDLHSNS